MKTLVLFSAVAALGFLGCSHPQVATRPAANSLPYHEPGSRAWSPANQASTQRECAPTTSTGEDATGGSGLEGSAQLPACPDATQ